MQKETYELPTITAIGSLRELTQDIDKCGGTGDQFLPLLLSERFSLDCDVP